MSTPRFKVDPAAMSRLVDWAVKQNLDAEQIRDESWRLLSPTEQRIRDLNFRSWHHR